MAEKNALPMTEEEYEGEIFIKAIAEEKLRQNGFSEGTIKNIDVAVNKIGMTGGEPFYRLAFRAAGSMNRPTEAVKILFLLMENYGINGDASMAKSYPVEMTHDFQGDLFAKGAELAGFLDTIMPDEVKLQNRPRPPAP